MTWPPTGQRQWDEKAQEGREDVSEATFTQSGNWLDWRVEGREELRVIQSFPPEVTKNMVRTLLARGLCVGLGG